MKSLHYFNPENDMAIGEGSHYYQPPAHIRSFKHDLAFLPFYLAGEQDLLLLPEAIDPAFVAEREQLSGTSVQLITPDQKRLPHYDLLSPWGWSRLAHEQLLSYKAACCDTFLSHPVSKWDTYFRSLYGKENVIQFLPQLLKHLEPYHTDFVPRRIDTIEQLQSFAVKHPLVVKTPWSGAGKGVRFFMSPDFDQSQQDWAKGMLRRNGFLTAARWVDKVVDFSMHFHVDFEGKITFKGVSAFDTGNNGTYQGSIVASQHHIMRLITNYADASEVSAIQQSLLATLPGLLHNQYQGYFGIDMMVFADQPESYRIHPFVELNLRNNMGLLALNLYQKLLFPSSVGKLLFTHAITPGALLRQDAQLKADYPLLINQGKISSGYYPLTFIDQSTQHSAYLIVG